MKKLLIVLMAIGLAGIAFGAALTDNRDTTQKADNYIEPYISPGAHIYAGAMVAMSNGYAVNAGDYAGQYVIGRADAEVDDDPPTTNETRIKVSRGVFNWAKTGEIGTDDIGKMCFVKDNQTVTTSNLTQTAIAGVIRDYLDSKVWVETSDRAGELAATPASLAVSGAATVGTTLSVAGAATLSAAATVGTTLGVTGAATFNGTANLRGAVTATNVTALSLNERKVISSKDNTTSLVIESGSATGTAVITFATAFGATPQVFITGATAGPAGTDATNFFAVQTSPRTNFTTTALGTTAFNWLAIGAK